MKLEIALIGLSLQVAIVATLMNLVPSLAVSWLLVKRRMPGAFVLDLLVSLPLALPPVAIGFFLLLLMGKEGPLGRAAQAVFGHDIVFTWFAAAIAGAVVSFPLMTRSIMVSMAAIDKRLEMSARSLGAGPWKVFATITLPLAYRGILAGLLMGFVRAISEFGATIVVAGNIQGRTETLSLAVYTNILLGRDGAALELIGVTIVLAVVTLAAHNWLLSRGRKRQEAE